MAFNRAVIKGLQTYWRWTRGMTLGAQAVIRNEQGYILLVRHGYKPGWCFPGGGVERGEAAYVSLVRELDEEVGVVPLEAARLFGIYTNFQRFPGDHIALYIVGRYERPRIPPPNAEIVAQEFFDPAALPADTNAGTRRRIAELIDHAAIDTVW